MGKIRIHGFSNKSKKEYSTWVRIRQRCNNPKHEKYRFYGAIGIKVCSRWDSFLNFLQDIGPAPSPKHSIDRIKSSGDYSPDNCRWATQKEQANNMKSNRVISLMSKTMTLSQWCDDRGLNYKLVHNRICKGWSESRALEIT